METVRLSTIKEQSQQCSNFKSCQFMHERKFFSTKFEKYAFSVRIEILVILDLTFEILT